MAEFFLELFSEEIPARMQEAAAAQLDGLCAQALKPLALSARQSPIERTFYGPRRLAVKANVAAEVPEAYISERGPRVSAPEQALAGFLRKHNSTKEDLVQEGEFWVLHKSIPGQHATAYLAAALPEALTKLQWPKSMRWGASGDFTWVRPLRRIVCLLDGEVISFALGPVMASNVTEGHRVHGPGPFEVSSAAVWEEKLREHKVLVNQGERKGKIASGIHEKVSALGLFWTPDESLLVEVNGLVEWPVPLIGRIDDEFMSLPAEVRELSMKINQKYFALRDSAYQADWKPAPYFAFVANLEADDGGAAIIAGNERVLRARLSDARHFWDLDLKTPLTDLLPKLEKITFHAKIGTQRARADRISLLAYDIALKLGGTDDEARQAEWAGKLAKADLVTGMVGEFPELQGVMGGYYAERNPRGWDGAVVGPAIKTHYQPKGPSDDVPSGIIAVSVALADKLDTLREFFAIGEKPTGSGDPYALRRCALGIIRIILENGLRLHLKPLLAGNDALFDFVIERLRVKLRGEGKRFDVLDAVLAAGADDDLVRVQNKVDALGSLLGTEDGKSLLAAYKRAANILRIEDAKDGPHAPDPVLGPLTLEEERDFRDMLSFLQQDTVEDFAAENYERVMKAFAKLRGIVDAFFDKVTVNDPVPEIRRNRLRLLAQLRDTMHAIADFSKIEN
jgi:glycyl-tRNA synthetase beta chain